MSNPVDRETLRALAHEVLAASKAFSVAICHAPTQVEYWGALRAHRAANTAWLESTTPAAVLALLDEIERMEGENERLKLWLTNERARYQAMQEELTPCGAVFAYRLRGKRDMCGEALAEMNRSLPSEAPAHE